MGNSKMWMRARFLSVGLLLPLAGGFGWAADGVTDVLDQSEESAITVAVPGSDTVIKLWDMVAESGEATPYYSIQTGDSRVLAERPVSPTVRLKYASFDPLVFEPEVPEALRADAANRLYVVQFHTQMINAFRAPLAEAGADLLKFVADQSFVVEMDAEAVERVRELPFVRWVGAIHPAYKVDPELIPDLAPMSGAEGGAAGWAEEAAPGNALGFNPGQGGDVNGEVVEYSIMMTRRGPVPQNAVANRIEAMGGEVVKQIPEGFRILAKLNLAQAAAVVRMNEVLFMDIPGERGHDMDIAREIGGGNFIRDTLGFNGEGVRCEVMDDGQRSTHQDFQNPPTLWHGTQRSGSHGTSTSGIVYGSGQGNSQATGMLPNAEAKIMAYWTQPSRYSHTQQLVDPQGPYRAVFQSNSWGDGRTRSYTTVSAEMDDILFQTDLLVCQSQSNAGNQDSRPQAWAKNIVSVGGVYHRNTLDKADDAWSGGGSTGPAADGRIKPDLTHFYDQIFTVSSSSDSSYTTSFGGTSGATPITAGHFGLMFQMWHEGVFPGFGGGNTVFDSRPAMATAKALMINSAEQYEFQGEFHDHGRSRQGWGMADLRYLYNHADDMLIVDQADQLEEFETATYTIDVAVRSSSIKVTMVYPDPMGNPNAQYARINDLTLKVTAPDNSVYWGNNGMMANMFTQPGGSANTVDTVENVFLESPLPGTWTIEVIASEINEDGYLQTPEIDATFALAASVGGEVPMELQLSRFVAGVNGDAEVFHATPGEQVAFVYSVQGQGSTYVPQLDVTLDLANPKLAGLRTADPTGYALLRKRIPSGTQGTRVYMQAAEFQRKSNVVNQVIE